MNTSKLSHLFHLNWDQLAANLLSIIWQLLITTLIFYLIFRWGRKIIHHYLVKKRPTQGKRTRTITALVNSIFQYTVIFFYLFGVLSIIGVPVGTLLASAGIFSLAIGMGAQGFVSDLVNGFFILSEDQFDVGDTVQINSELGSILQLGLRTTRIRTSDGAVVYIPNRNITMVKNLGHSALTLTINLNLAADNDFKQVAAVIKKINQQMKSIEPIFASEPHILGLTAQKGPNAVFSVVLKVKAGQQSQAKNLYLTSSLAALKKNHIRLALPSEVK